MSDKPKCQVCAAPAVYKSTIKPHYVDRTMREQVFVCEGHYNELHDKYDHMYITSKIDVVSKA